MLFQRQNRTLTVWAPAKLNLFLEVHGKRPDGYHELETLMVTLDHYDTLRFAETSAASTRMILRPVEVSCSSSSTSTTPAHESQAATLPAGSDNLIVRAAELLRQETGYTGGVEIELFKRIPMAAGLAGGSSDAAATLMGLNQFWNLQLSLSQLSQLAARLGSDVPFFLEASAAAICRGRGEQVEPCSLPLRMHFVVVKPPTGLSTPQVFRQCRPADQPRSVQPLVAALRQGHLSKAGRLLHNGLQAAAETLNTDVQRVKAAFRGLSVLGHMMSGSGTSYFGLCASRRHALQVSSRLKAARLGHVFVAQSRA